MIICRNDMGALAFCHVLIYCIVDLLYSPEVEGILQPEFDTTPVTVTATIRDPVRLPCSVENLGPYEVLWWDDYGRLVTFQDIKINGDVVFDLERGNQTDWTLLIKSADKQNEGNYFCQVSTSPIMSKTVTLKVAARYRNATNDNSKPKFGVTERWITAIKGSTAVLPCGVFNLGWHEVVWTTGSTLTVLMVEDKRVTNDERYSIGKSFTGDSSLHIKNVEESDEGSYWCQVNTEPVTSIKVTLEVKKKVQFPPEIVRSSKSLSFGVEGSSISLPCSVRNLGDFQVLWYDTKSRLLTVGERRVIDDERISIVRPTVKEWNLHIRNVTYQDSNKYHCVVATQHVRFATVDLFTLDKIAALKRDIEDSLRCRKNPGLAVTVVKDGEIVLAEGFGVADIDKDIPVTNRTLFGVASLSKAFAATLLLKLISRRKDISLETKVTDILPDFGFPDEFRTKYTTLEDILSHRTGLPSNNAIRLDTNLTRENLPGRIKHLKATGKWRGSYIYNNLMYGVVTRIAEVLGGASWEELVQREIYDPLQMTSSNFATKLDFSSDQVAKPYSVDDGNIIPVNVELSRRWALLCGSGCVFTNAEDAANWIKFHLSQGLDPSGERVMEEEDVKQLYVPRTAMPNYSLNYFSKPDVPVTSLFGMYAFGWRIGYYRGYKMTAHSGSTYGYRALLTLLPTEKLGIFIATTGSDPSYAYRFSLQNYIADTILGEKPWLNVSTMCSFPEPWFKPQTTSTNYNVSKALSRGHEEYEGIYHNTPYGNLEIYYNTTQGQLMAKYGFARFLLYQQNGGNFYGEGYGITDARICSSMSFRKGDSAEKFEEIKVECFDSRSPPIFIRQGQAQTTTGTPSSGFKSTSSVLIAITTVYAVLSSEFSLTAA